MHKNQLQKSNDSAHLEFKEGEIAVIILGGADLTHPSAYDTRSKLHMQSLNNSNFIMTVSFSLKG